LMGTLGVVMFDEGLGDRARVLQGRRPLHQQAFLGVGAMIPFDKSILLRMMGIRDLHLDAQTGAEAQESRREIAALWTAHPAGIVVQGDEEGESIALQGLGEGG